MTGSEKISIFSFFSGSGFLDLGFDMADFDIVFVNEFSKEFMNAYQYSRKNLGIEKSKYGYAQCDVNEFLFGKFDQLNKYIENERKHNIVGFIGGPPCPDFSVAGKQRGKDGDNGKLSLSYVNLIISHRPDFFLFENVKGLWKTAKHREFYEELKEKLSDADYMMTERLTNALEFGVPQDRDRILLFGVKKNILKDLNKKIDSFNWNENIIYDLQEVKNMPWPSQSPFVVDSDLPCPDNIIKKLTVEYWFKNNDVLNHPNAKDHFIPRSGISKMETINEGDDSKKSYKRLHRWRFSPTVAYGNNEVHLHPYKVRRISAAEALALQTLPKGFCLPPEMSLTNKFKTIGNGVPFLLSNGVAKTIYNFLKR